MNKTAHSRTRTQYQPMASSIMSKATQCSGIRIKTTPSQLNHTWTMRGHSNSQSCFQQAHILTLSKAEPHKTKQILPQQADRQDQSTKYILESIIAKGAFSVVYKAHSSTQHRLAVKKVPIEDHKNRELTVLKNITHPNILKMIDHYFTVDNNHRYLHIVTQQYSHTLRNLIDLKITPTSLFPLYLYQILRGLVYLKQKDIIHRDLTPSNILVQNNTHKVVIADFGSAKISHHQPHSLSYLVARAYRAPQLVFGSMSYSNQVDMWAFACMAGELVSGRPLFHSQSNIEHMLQIIKVLGTPSQQQMCEINPDFSLKEFQSLPKIRKRALKDVFNSSDSQLLDLLGKILVYVPKKRMSASDALQHPYFDCLRTTQYYQQNKIDPEQLSIQLNQSYQKQIVMGPSSIRIQSNHKRLISCVSKMSESTVGQSTVGQSMIGSSRTAGESTMRSSGGKTFRLVDGVARKLVFK